MSKQLIIMGKHLLVKIIPSVNTSSIMTVNTSNFIKAQIIQIGNGYSGNSELYNMSVFCVNDIVTFNEKAAQSITFDNQRYLIVDVLNVISIEKEEI